MDWRRVGCGVLAVFVGMVIRGVGEAGEDPGIATESAAHRPLVAVVAENDGTEITDFLVPFGVLAASGVADVVAVAVHPGPVQLMPAALTVALADTFATIDARHPGGPDYVVVPAVHRATDPLLLDWLRAAGARGATIVGICDGAWVLAAAGLLEGRTATGHWYSRRSLAARYPGTRWIEDRRWVRDGPIVTTTGVSASLPAALALVATIAGAARAESLARNLGAADVDAAHEGGRYRLTRASVGTAAANWLAVWRWERVAVSVEPGVDEIALAFTADAWARTYRTSAAVVSAGGRPVMTRHGLTLRPAVAAVDDVVVPLAGGPPAPAQALPTVLATIAARYGEPTAAFVALQLETEWEPTR